MGNRAVITFDDYTPEGVGLYLHWNGGRGSIEGFLKATRILMEGRVSDGVYSRARLTQVIGTFFGGNLSFGMGACKELDCTGDNGVFIVDSTTMTIKGRAEWDASWGEDDDYDTNEFANEIIKRINAGYVVNNEEAGEYSQLGMLPTAEEYDAEQLEAK